MFVTKTNPTKLKKQITFKYLCIESNFSNKSRNESKSTVGRHDALFPFSSNTYTSLQVFGLLFEHR